jgi:isomerase DpgB
MPARTGVGEHGDGVIELAGGLGFDLEIDCTRSLTELTAVLTAVCARAEDRTGPAVIILRLHGMAVGERSWPGPVGIQAVNRWERAVRRLERLASVCVAVASGTGRGPVLDLLLAADYRIVDADFRLLLPVNDSQFWPGMAVYRLANEIGLARARHLVLWGAEITAARAGEIGLVDEVSSDLAESVRVATVWLGRLAGPELAIRRQLLLEAPGASFEDALGPHLAACDRELRRLRSEDRHDDDR